MIQSFRWYDWTQLFYKIDINWFRWASFGSLWASIGKDLIL